MRNIISNVPRASCPRIFSFACAAVLGLAVAAQAQSTREPHVGYIYPAGGQQAKTVYVAVGGQFLRGASEVFTSDPAIRAEVVKHYRPLGNINGDERRLLTGRLLEVRDLRLAELGIDPPPVPAGQNRPVPEGIRMPEHPLLDELDGKSLRELAHIREVLFHPLRRRQTNRQLAEVVLLRVNIAATAAPGNHELRILTAAGLTNPVVFQVDQLPEAFELEPNDKTALAELAEPGLPRQARLPQPKPLELPVVLNGQIFPGDVDRFRFQASQGQNLVIQVHARGLIPYLADAVPGWFQAVATLYDDRGNEIAFADDFRFNPDPVLLCQVPRTGQYELQIQDAIFRGREDFVYRIAISERPFITRIFPLVCPADKPTVAAIEGWNLPTYHLPLDARTDLEFIAHATCENDKGISNPAAYAVSPLPQTTCPEPGDAIDAAQPLELPTFVNGRIDQPGDLDVFAVSAKAGKTIVAEVYARCLNSPLDAILRLTDETGKVLAWNDDNVVTGDEFLYRDTTGLLTHHADPYLSYTLDADATCFLHLADAQGHGGPEYAYALRVSEPRGDFELRVTPASLLVPAGANVPVTVYVLRKDGFDGQVALELRKPHAGFTIHGGIIPPGCDRLDVTIQGPAKPLNRPIPLVIVGKAIVNGRTVARRAVPAEDMMQAFLYRHLVPARQLLAVAPKPGWLNWPFELATAAPLQLQPGRDFPVKVNHPRRAAFNKLDLEIRNAPPGLAIKNVSGSGQNTTMTFQVAATGTETANATGNLIIEVFGERPAPQADNKPDQPKAPQRFSLGLLPAIPVTLTR